MVKKYNNELIIDWVRAIDFTNAENKAAYIVKAVKEGWQLPEEYLREKEAETIRKKQGKNQEPKETKARENQQTAESVDLGKNEETFL